MMNPDRQLFTGNAFSHAKKEVGKEFTGYILCYREASNQVVADFPFFFLSHFSFMFVSVSFFCYAGALNMEASKLSLRFNFFNTTL